MPSFSGSCSCFLIVLWSNFSAPLPMRLAAQYTPSASDVADAFAPDDPVEQPEEAPLDVGRHAREIRVGEDAGFEQLEREGHDLRRREAVHAVFGRALRDLEAELQVRIRRHGVSELGVALHHVGRLPRHGDGRPHFIGQL